MSQKTSETNQLSAKQLNDFVNALREHSVKEGIFDSVASSDFVKEQIDSAAPDFVIPKELKAIYDQVDESKHGLINRAILDSIKEYEARHAMPCPPDLLQMAIHSAWAATPEGGRGEPYYDSAADSNHANNFALQPNRSVIAILSTITEGIPIAHYLPADIRSNEALLNILSHHAGSTSGGYSEGDSLDGVSSGETYISTSRMHTSTATVDSSTQKSTGVITGKITKIQETRRTCKQDAGDLKLMRGRTLVYIAGRVVASESSTTGSGNSPVSGSFKVGGTSYTLSGNINTDTGSYSFSTTPALPETVKVTVQGFIDFERDPSLTPTIKTDVDTYRLHANPWRVTTRISPDARSQIANELGLDSQSESIMAIHGQFGNERHYQVLDLGLALGENNLETFDFAAAKAHQDSSASEAWRDFAIPLSRLSQKMAEATIDHGVTHLYVTKTVSAMLQGLPSNLFAPSGLPEKPCIYRLGRLFGRYEVYYTPKVLTETTTTSNGISAQILCAGRASNVAQNPVVLGDAVAPSVIPLAVGEDLKQGAGFYARNFTCVNPHEPSSNGFGIIEVTGLSF